MMIPEQNLAVGSFEGLLLGCASNNLSSFLTCLRSKVQQATRVSGGDNVRASLLVRRDRAVPRRGWRCSRENIQRLLI